MARPLHKSVTRRIELVLPDPDVDTNVKRVPLSPYRLIVARCDVLADENNSSDVRIGCENVEGESSEARGERLTAGERMTLPATDLAWWYVVGDTAGDVVTWAAEIEVNDDGTPIDV